MHVVEVSLKKRHLLLGVLLFAFLYAGLLGGQYSLYTVIEAKMGAWSNSGTWFLNFFIAVALVMAYIEAVRGFRHERDLIWTALWPGIYATVLYKAFEIGHAEAIPFVIAFDFLVFLALLYPVVMAIWRVCAKDTGR